MNVSKRRSFLLIFGVLIGILLIGAAIASAQSTPPSIPIGQIQTGTITSATGISQFSVSVTSPQNVNVQILATSPGFATAFRVYDPINAVIFEDDNASAQNITQDQVTLASPGTYIIEVRSANNTTGQFAISVQPGTPFNPPIPLQLETPITATVDPQDPRKVYSFTALTTDALFVEAASTSPTSGPVVRLVDADSGDAYGLANAHLTLGRFRMPIGTTNYLLEVTHSGSTFPESVVICLWPEHGTPCSGNGGSGTTPSTPTTPGTCSCDVTVSSKQNINIRQAPGSSTIVGTLPAGMSAQVLGELPSHTWIKVNYDGVIGWVLALAVTVNNPCPGIPVITPTTPPRLLPTPTTPHNTIPTATLPPPVIITSTPTIPVNRLPTRNPNASPTPTQFCPPTIACTPRATPTLRILIFPTFRLLPTATPTFVPPK